MVNSTEFNAFLFPFLQLASWYFKLQAGKWKPVRYLRLLHCKTILGRDGMHEQERGHVAIRGIDKKLSDQCALEKLSNPRKASNSTLLWKAVPVVGHFQVTMVATLTFPEKNFHILFTYTTSIFWGCIHMLGPALILP